MAKGNWGNTAQWVSAAANMKQAHAMQNMTGAIAQQNAMMAAQLTKQEQIAEARRNLIAIEEQFTLNEKTAVDYPEYASLILGDLSQSIEALLPYFSEFSDIERAKNTKNTIDQFNNSIKSKFQESEHKVVNSLKHYPEKIESMTKVLNSKKEIGEKKLRIKDLEEKKERRKKYAIVPALLLILLTPLSYSIYSSLPELPAEYEVFTIDSDSITISHSGKFSSLENLSNVKWKVDQSDQELLNNSEFDAGTLGYISERLDIALNNTNPELKSLYKGTVDYNAWPIGMESGEVAVTYDDNATYIQRLIHIDKYPYELQRTMDCFDRNNHCLVTNLHTQYNLWLDHDTGNISGFSSLTTRADYYLFKNAMPGCTDNVALIQLHVQYQQLAYELPRMNRYEDSSIVSDVKNEDNYEYFYGIYGDQRYRFGLIGVDDFMDDDILWGGGGQYSECDNRMIDGYNPEILQLLSEEITYDNDNGWGANGEVIVSTFELCERIYFPLVGSNPSDVIVEEPKRCTVRPMSIPIGIVIAFGFVTMAMLTRTREHRNLNSDIKQLSSVIAQYGMEENPVEEISQWIEDYTLVLNDNIPSLEYFEVLKSRESQQLQQNDVGDIWETSPNQISKSRPEVSAVGIPDQEGYEWTKLEDGSDWYRILGSNSEWQRFET